MAKIIFEIPSEIDEAIMDFQKSYLTRYNTKKPTKSEVLEKLSYLGLKELVSQSNKMKKETDKFYQI